jgi:hypothetical protein
MRVLTLTELMRLTRTELCSLFSQILNELAAFLEGSPERDAALMNLRNIRWGPGASRLLTLVAQRPCRSNRQWLAGLIVAGAPRSLS